MCYIIPVNSIGGLKRMIIDDYASVIKKLRKKMNCSQTELAEILGVSFASVNRWENGAHEPTIKVKKRLRELFIKYELMEEEKSVTNY